MRRKKLFYVLLILSIFNLKNVCTHTSEKETLNPKEVSYCYYDENNKYLAMQDFRGITKYEYEENDQICKITFPDKKKISFAYNEKGKLQTITYPDGKQIAYEYDDRNALRKIIDTSGETELEHSQKDRLTKIIRPNGIISEFVYDENGRIFSTVHKREDEKLIIGFNYQYDEKGHLTNEKKITPSSTVDTTYTLEDKIQRKESNGFILEFQYDDEGRILKQIRNNEELIYYYDENGLLLQAGNINYFYDDIGNIVRVESQDDWANLTYDANNRLVKYEDKENTVEYLYNADNLLMTRIANGFETRFYKDQFAPIPSLLYESTEKDDYLAQAVYHLFGAKDTDETSYVYGDGILHCYAENNPLFYLLTKQDGDVLYLFDKHKKIWYDKESESIYKPLLNSRLHVSTLSNNLYVDPITHLLFDKTGHWIDFNMNITYNKDPIRNVVRLPIEQLKLEEEPKEDEKPIVTDEPKKEPKEDEKPIVVDEPKEEPKEDEKPIVIDEPKEEPLDDISLEEAVALINDPQGIVYDEENNQVILFGYENSSLPKGSYKIFSSTMQTMLSEQNPSVSLMTSKSQSLPLHIYMGNVVKRAGDLLFALALEENTLHQKITPNVPGYHSLAQFFLNKKMSGSKVFDVSLKPAKVSLITSSLDDVVMIADIKIDTRAEEQTIRKLHPEYVSHFATHLSTNFDNYAKDYTDWANYLYLVKVIQIATWIKEKDLTLHEEVPILNIKMPYHFVSPSKTYQWTEDKERIKIIKRKKWYGTRKREKKVIEPVTRYLTVSLQGGVTATCNNVVKVQRDNMITPVKEAIMKARSDTNKLYWNFTMPNNQKAVAVALTIE